jgi:hypothetical protein
MADNNNNEHPTEDSSSQDPPIYKYLSPKTQAYLNQSHRARLEQEIEDKMSANEQT